MEKKWWHSKVAYQIYPKSFCDSNGDGIGDIQGIIGKLDYLKTLGVDIIWLSPIYLSPCADQGYDIADYYEIDPKFGTMKDMDQLLEEAKKRNIEILMDLVVNHCSDEHPWFQKALENPDGEFGEFFYIGEKKNGRLPCNWRSYFGGSVWEPIPGTDKYYLHLFHKKQPDLNWENPKLRQAVYQMINWWLDKGLAGFRIDAIINIKKPLPFRDYPADREDGLCDMGQVLADADGIGAFLGEMRDMTFNPHQALTIGEVFNSKPEELEAFIGKNGYFSSMFDFRQTIEGKSPKGWYDNRIPTPEDYKRCCFESQRASEQMGYLSNIIENHDEPRGVSHYLPAEAQCEKGKKMLAAMYFMLRGLPFIYQGQELGMENKKGWTLEEVDDVSAKEEYRRCLEVGYDEAESMKIVGHYSRDNTRTPFPWSDESNGGFTTGTPWICMNPDYRTVNAKEQMAREDSVFSFYQKLIFLRKNEEYRDTIVYGDTEPVLENEINVMAYIRRSGDQEILVIGNFENRERRVEADWVKNPEEICLLLSNGGSLRMEKGTIWLEPLQALVLVKKTALNSYI